MWYVVIVHCAVSFVYMCHGVDCNAWKCVCHKAECQHGFAAVNSFN